MKCYINQFSITIGLIILRNDETFIEIGHLLIEIYLLCHFFVIYFVPIDVLEVTLLC
jgi:hypothetical protein